MQTIKLKSTTRLLAFLVLFCTGIYCSAQEKDPVLDSLLIKLSQLEKNAITKANHKAYVDLLLRISFTYTDYNQDSLLHYAKKVNKVSKKFNYIDGIVLGTIDEGLYHSLNGENQKGITYYKRAIAMADSANFTTKHDYLYNTLGLEYNYILDYEKALFYFLKGLDHAEQLKDSLRISEISENIAIMYSELEQYEHASKLYQKIVTLNAAIDNKIATAETFLNLSALEAEMGRFNKAMTTIDKSIAYFEKNGPKNWTAYAYEIKGYIYLKQKKYKWALYWLDQSSLLLTQIEDGRYISQLYLRKAAAHLGLQQYEMAKDYAFKGLDGLKKHPNNHREKELLEVLYQISKQTGQLDKALEYHELYAALSDTINRSKNQNTLALYKTKMAFEQDKQLIISENKKALAKQRNIMWSSIAVLIILLAMAIPLYLNHKKLRALVKKIKANSKVLQEREVQLRTTNTTKDRLFSIIGHDLRGPIGALRELLRLVSNGDIEKNGFNELLPKIKTDVDHILFTLNNLLSWGNAQAKGGRSLPKMVLLRKIAEQNVALLSEMAAHKNISITNKIPTDALVLVDENQLDVVIRNLISNAIKFTPNNGSITLKAEVSGDFWKTQVQDTGVGMDEATKQQIFKANANITNYGTNNEKGTGLGLSLCKEMVSKNKGNIWVESAPQIGSTFSFTVPKVSQNYLKTA